MVIGEVQEDFAFSDRSEGAEPVGAGRMYAVLDDAVRCRGVMLPVPKIERTANPQNWEAGCS